MPETDPQNLNLDGARTFATVEIMRATSDRSHPFRNAVLSTAGIGGAKARIIVLRKATEAPLSVEFHTDIRSSKIEDINNNQRVALLLWHPELKLQVRLRATAELVSEASKIRAAWQKTPRTARLSYNSEAAPGTAISSETWIPADQRTAADLKYFGILKCAVHEMEVLILRSKGHLRARFIYTNGEVVDAQFLVP